MVITEKYGYEKQNTDIVSDKDIKRVCAYFVVSDLHKITSADICFKTEELIEEINNHENWVLESVVWDANHKIDTNRQGLNIILDKAKNNEFDILLLHHVTLISRSGSKTFDYAAQLFALDKVVYGIIDKIHSFDDLADSLHLTVSRQKQYEELRKIKNNIPEEKI